MVVGNNSLWQSINQECSCARNIGITAPPVGIKLRPVTVVIGWRGRMADIFNQNRENIANGSLQVAVVRRYSNMSAVAAAKNEDPSKITAPMAMLCIKFMRLVRFPSQS